MVKNWACLKGVTFCQVEYQQNAVYDVGFDLFLGQLGDCHASLYYFHLYHCGQAWLFYEVIDVPTSAEDLLIPQEALDILFCLCLCLMVLQQDV